MKSLAEGGGTVLTVGRDRFEAVVVDELEPGRLRRKLGFVALDCGGLPGITAVVLRSEPDVVELRPTDTE